MQYIKDLTTLELDNYFEKIDEKKFRTKQLFNALYQQKINNFNEITTFSSSLKKQLEENFYINSLELETIRESIDGTKKILYSIVNKNEFIETVFLPNNVNDTTNKKNTICISTMLGCPVNCIFCATAKLGFKRTLTASEIIDQILITEKIINKKIDNVVIMGMGEPLLNFNNTILAIRTLIENNIIKHRNITLSTIGIPDKIIELADSNIKIKLALSLHSPFDDIRKTLIPMASNLSDIFNSLEYYYKKTKLPITFEYILLKGLNNRNIDILQLSKLIKKFPSKINIIPFNDISFTNTDYDIKAANTKEINIFSKKLYQNKIMSIIRKSQGQDIEAACGQLAYSKTKIKFK